MRADWKTPLFGAGLMITLAGCQSAPAGSTAAPPPVPPGGAALISAEDAAAGRALYVNKCARCHKFHDPAKYDDADWNRWMTKMSRKAKLKPAQAELLGRYLDVYRQPGGTNVSAAPAAGRKAKRQAP
jgi:cytochrome c5